MINSVCFNRAKTYDFALAHWNPCRSTSYSFPHHIRLLNNKQYTIHKYIYLCHLAIKIHPSTLYTSSTLLVNLSLSKTVDLLSTILNLAVGSLETAQVARALLDVVIAYELVVGYAVESAVALFTSASITHTPSRKELVWVLWRWIRTSSRSSRHTLARRTINSASILLERLLGDTASAVSSLTVLKHAAGSVADVLDVGDGGGGDGDEAEEEGCDGELHFGGFEVCWVGSGYWY